jgi:lipid-binding SYLF domain-containing protein
MRTAIELVALTALFMMTTGCSTAPKTQAEKRSLVGEADAAVTSMTARDPSLRDLIDGAPGYVIFPDVGKAGAIIGGAYGRGVVYEQGRPVGFAELNQGSIGAQIGAQSYSELVVFENEAALGRLKAGNFDLGAEASAVALKAGAGKSARFEGGVAVFQHTRGGLMAAAAVNGQKLNYEQMDRSVTAGGGGATRPSTQSSSEMQLRSDRTGGDAGDPAAERLDPTGAAAQSATERTERRIEERLQETEQRAKDSAGDQQQ